MAKRRKKRLTRRRLVTSCQLPTVVVKRYTADSSGSSTPLFSVLAFESGRGHYSELIRAKNAAAARRKALPDLERIFCKRKR